eukprot:2426316-Rhodomonas_salina.1
MQDAFAFGSKDHRLTIDVDGRKEAHCSWNLSGSRYDSLQEDVWSARELNQFIFVLDVYGASR